MSSETADAVITVDRVDRVADAVHTGRRALFIARQSVLAGMGLSIAAMGVAAAGHLPPVAGALFQEVIDLAVILNALRALRDGHPASKPGGWAWRSVGGDGPAADGRQSASTPTIAFEELT